MKYKTLRNVTERGVPRRVLYGEIAARGVVLVLGQVGVALVL